MYFHLPLKQGKVWNGGFGMSSQKGGFSLRNKGRLRVEFRSQGRFTSTSKVPKHKGLYPKRMPYGILWRSRYGPYKLAFITGEALAG